MYLITVNAVSTGVGILLLYVQVHVFYAVSYVTSTTGFPRGKEQPVCVADRSHKPYVHLKFMEPFLHWPHLAGTSKSKRFTHFIKNLCQKLGAAIMNNVAINYTFNYMN